MSLTSKSTYTAMNETSKTKEDAEAVLGGSPCSPVRVTLSRRKGWKMPPNTVKVDRSTKWGNPWKKGDKHPGFGMPMTAEEAVHLYRKMVVAGNGHITVKRVRAALRGKNLACWCKQGCACHADVLLDLANAQGQESPDTATR